MCSLLSFVVVGYLSFVGVCVVCCLMFVICCLLFAGLSRSFVVGCLLYVVARCV